MRKNNIFIAAIFLVLICIAGCSSGTQKAIEQKPGKFKYDDIKGEFSFEMFDSTDAKLCEGLLTLTMPDTVNVIGKISISKVYKENFPGLMAIGKEAEGRYYEQSGMLSLNTNPVVADNNVYINVKPSSGSLTGTWSQVTIAGVRNKGRFIAVRR